MSEAEAEADAVALFRPRSLEALKPFLDLDDESEESDGLYAESLDDGSILVHTFQPYAAFAADEAAASEWLAQFGDALPEVHADPRGLLFFPDTCEPEARTYEDVVREVEAEGTWIATSEVADDLAALGLPLGALPPGVDFAQLQELAAQLVGGGGAGGPQAQATSFDIGRMFEGVQQQLMEALGGAGASAETEGSDPEDAPAAPGSSVRPKR